MPILSIHNFQYHSDGEFNLPDKGACLITGKSGTGKSTIIRAIYWCLYGKVKHPLTFGTTTGYVQLTYSDPPMIIRRSIRPNNFKVTVLSRKYTGDIAQEYIDGTFGTETEFCTSSLILQKDQASIVFSVPSRQKEIINRLMYAKKGSLVKGRMDSTFQTASDYIEKLKDKLASINNSTRTLEGSIDTAKVSLHNQRSSLKAAKDCVPEDIPEVEIVDVNELSVDIDRYIKARKDLKGKIQSITEQLKIIEESVSSFESIEREKERIKDALKEIEKTMESYRDINDEVVIIELDKVNEELAFRETVRKFESSLSEYDTATSMLCKDRELDSLKDSLLDETTIEAYTKSLAEKRTLLDSINTWKDIMQVLNDHEIPFSVNEDTKVVIDRVNREIEGIEKVLENMDKTNIYKKAGMLKCPSCQVDLRIDYNSELDMTELYLCNIEDDEGPEISTEVLKESLQGLRKVKKNIEKSKVTKITEQIINPDIDSLTSEIEHTQKMLEEQVAIRLKIGLLDNKVTEEKLANMKFEIDKKYDELIKEYGKVEYDRKYHIIEGEYKDIMSLKGTYTERLVSLKNERVKLDTFSKRRVELISRLKELSNEKIDDDSIVEDRNKLRDDVQSLQKKDEKYANYISLYERKKAYLTQKKLYDGLYCTYTDTKKLVDIHKEELEKLQKRARNILELQKMIIMAESKSLNSIIYTINTLAAEYLDMMFDEKILVELASTTETTKGKLKYELSVLVEYRGNKYNSIKQLSGGEADRVSLAFILAVNEMMDSKVLMLDESFSTLDTDQSLEIIDSVKVLTGDKMCIIVQHGGCEGRFENHINLGDQ